MSTIPPGTDYRVQTTVNATSLDTDTESIRAVIDADTGIGAGSNINVGIDGSNLSGSTSFRREQTAEPSARMMINVPFLDIVASATELGPFNIRVYAVAPGNGRLVRCSIGWRLLSVQNNNTFIKFSGAVLGYPVFPGGTNYASGANQTPEGVAGASKVLQTTADLKALQFINRPSVAAWQPIPIDLQFDFDGNTFTVEGLRFQIEMNIEHTA